MNVAERREMLSNLEKTSKSARSTTIHRDVLFIFIGIIGNNNIIAAGNFVGS